MCKKYGPFMQKKSSVPDWVSDHYLDKYFDRINLDNERPINPIKFGVFDPEQFKKKRIRKAVATDAALRLATYTRHTGERTPPTNRGGNESPGQTWNNIYMRTYWCQKMVEVTPEGRFKTYSCNSRICPVCNARRTAEAFEKYSPVIKAWHAPYFVTLTIKNVNEEELQAAQDEMYDVFCKIKDNYRKKYREKFQGIRKIECTYGNGTFHPHYHFIVRNFSQAEHLVKEWQKFFKERAHNAAQDITKFDKSEKGFKEMFKYAFKMAHDPHKQEKFNAWATHVINKSMYGRRTYQTYGFKLSKFQEEPEVIRQTAEEFLGGKSVIELEELADLHHEADQEQKAALKVAPDLYQWNPDKLNWIGAKTGLAMFNCKLSDQEKERIKLIRGEMYEPYPEPPEIPPSEPIRPNVEEFA